MSSSRFLILCPDQVITCRGTLLLFSCFVPLARNPGRAVCGPHLTGGECEVRKESAWPRALGESGPEVRLQAASPASQSAYHLGTKRPGELRPQAHPRQSLESRALGPLLPPHEAFTVHHLDPLGHQAETLPEGLNWDGSEASRGPFLLAGPAGYHELLVGPYLVSPA